MILRLKTSSTPDQLDPTGSLRWNPTWFALSTAMNSLPPKGILQCKGGCTFIRGKTNHAFGDPCWVTRFARRTLSHTREVENMPAANQRTHKPTRTTTATSPPSPALFQILINSDITTEHTPTHMHAEAYPSKTNSEGISNSAKVREMLHNLHLPEPQAPLFFSKKAVALLVQKVQYHSDWCISLHLKVKGTDCHTSSDAHEDVICVCVCVCVSRKACAQVRPTYAVIQHACSYGPFQDLAIFQFTMGFQPGSKSSRFVTSTSVNHLPFAGP